jgi:hypothetical protein
MGSLRCDDLVDGGLGEFGDHRVHPPVTLGKLPALRHVPCCTGHENANYSGLRKPVEYRGKSA